MRRWIALAALLIALAALLALAAAMLRGIGVWLGGAGVDSGAPDPMFEATEPPVTRPPGLYGDADTPPSMDDDPSRQWVYATLTPVSTVEPSRT